MKKKLFVFFISALLISFSIFAVERINYYLSLEQKLLIKKYLFPYKEISQLEERLFNDNKEITDNINSKHWSQIELEKKKKGSEIKTAKKVKKLSKNKSIKVYQLKSGFYSGINLAFPGSGYIDFYQNNIVVLSSRGVLAFKQNINNDKENFKQINNNINEFINISQFKKRRWFSLKDILIYNDKIFISYTEEIKEDCWNTSIISGKMNLSNIKFKKIFSPKKCIYSNKDNEFNAHQSGGRIAKFDNNHVLLSVGDYRQRYLAQDKQSVNGKIIKINIFNSNFEIISMGHRNPQGLYFDEENNLILETEHGPQGGDEINLINVNKISEDKIQNYGWPISSAGEHYQGKIEINKEKYKKYPLYKSHSEHGFIEPLHSFVPSIGISEIVKIAQNEYVVSSLNDNSLYFFKLNKKQQITNLNRIEIMDRIRDLKFYNKQLFLFMEETASIGVINLI